MPLINALESEKKSFKKCVRWFRGKWKIWLKRYIP